MKFIVKLNFGEAPGNSIFSTPTTITLVCEADNLSDIVSRYTQENMFSVQTQSGVKIINPRNVNWIDIDEYKEQTEQEQNSSWKKAFPDAGENTNE